MNFIFPGNAKIFTYIMLQIINAELLDPEWTTEYLYDFSTDNKIMEEIKLQQIDTLLID